MYPSDLFYNDSKDKYEIMIPDFDIDYIPEIDNFFYLLGQETRDYLTQGVITQFACGVNEFQEQYITDWVWSVLKDRGYSIRRAASVLGIGRTNLSKRANGKIVIKINDVCSIYINIFKKDLSDPPALLLPWKRLALGGYIKAVSFLREKIGEKQEKDFLLDLSEETFLYLFYYYRSIKPVDFFDNLGDRDSKIERLSRETRAEIRRIGIKQYILSHNDWIDVIQNWGQAWLLCLSILAGGGSHGNTRNICDKIPVLVRREQ